MSKSQPTLVMSGRLEEFRLADVLQAVSSSRQTTAVELRRSDGVLRGTIWIESGRVVDAVRGDTHGRAAFYDLFGAAGDDIFIVQRLHHTLPQPEPIGSVASLVLEAVTRSSEIALGSSPSMPIVRPPTFDGVWDEPTVARPLRRGAAVIAIASARGGVGRTTIALHLARAFARAGLHALLIDGDGGDLAAQTGLCAAPLSLEELLDRTDAIDDALCDVAPGIRVLPVAPASAARLSVAFEWHALVARARSRADVTIVDCPAGTTGVAADIAAACTHVVGVVRSDRTASVAAHAIEGAVDALAGGPELAGIVVNLFDPRSPPNVEAFQRVAADGVPLLETTIPRADALAADLSDEPGPIDWLFDALAAEVKARTCPVERPASAPAWLAR